MDLFAVVNPARLRRFFPLVDAVAGVVVVGALISLLALANGLGWLQLPGSLFAVIALTQVVLIVAVGLVWARCAEGASRRLGWANRITLYRSLLIMIIAGFAAFPAVAMQHLWALAGLSLLALCLDGVDGWVARRTDSQTAFGARFDMEMDALFILVLAALLVATNVAGLWVVAMGVLRYAFMAAGWLWSWLQAPLPDSFRRKLVCVWQIATLMVCLVPWVPGLFSTAALALALTLVVYSFAVDIKWLHEHREASARTRSVAVAHE